MAEEHQIKVLDYLKDKKFNDNDFWNPDHLNYLGAKKLSNLLAKELS